MVQLNGSWEKLTMKILNLYAGIGGNRKLWGDEHEVTAVEINPEIAKVYQYFFPNDKVVVGDAHKFLLEHFQEFDFIWSSPPCPTHSKIRRFSAVERGQNKPVFPDMKLYEEIIFLMSYFKGEFVVENVVGFYEPLIKPFECGQHYYWSSFIISNLKLKSRMHNGSIEDLEKLKGFSGTDWGKFKVDRRIVLRNCVEPEIALKIFNMGFKIKQQVLGEICV